jgi:competence protein ComEA
VIAQAIVDFRTENGPFTTIEDLLDVSGIGDATFADMKDLITI